jgi:hypothetical protein
VTAPGRPLLLVADDLQWADTETLQFLHYLLRTRPQAPLLVAATARDDDLGDQHPLHALRTGLTALGQLVELELGRLSPQETAALGGSWPATSWPTPRPSACSPRPRATRCSWSRCCAPAGTAGRGSEGRLPPGSRR